MVLLGSVTDEYNESLVFSPDERRLLYSVREPISNRVFSSSRQRGFANKSVFWFPRQSPCSVRPLTLSSFFFFCLPLQGERPLPLLGRLHGGGRRHFLRVQRRRHRHREPERGGPPPNRPPGRLSQWEASFGDGGVARM